MSAIEAIRKRHDQVEFASVIYGPEGPAQHWRQIHKDRGALLAEIDRLTAKIDEAVRDLRDDHRPTWVSEQAERDGKTPIGCVICFPGDGRWPCASRTIAYELAEGSTE